ncbi:MAG: phosphoenolpyruvate synthase [Gammaproteobacteria bacterium]|nr:phosphoenolpyruvate synthase [Gammaproteobacteria bacterium]
MPWILFPQAEMTLEQAGGKAFSLKQMRQAASFPIPPWFVITPEVFSACLANETLPPTKTVSDTLQLRRLLDGLVLPDDILEQLSASLKSLCPDDERVAVRSSAVDEDGAQHSFAGQLDTFLFVHPRDVAARVIQVWRSGFSERIMAYRKEAGMTSPPPVPAVLIQRMVDAERSGVAFGVDPVTGDRNSSVVASVYGLGSALVSGEIDADTFHVDGSETITRREIVAKTIAHRIDPSSEEGVSERPVDPARVKLPSLDDREVREVAALARRAGDHFGAPQDIEWAITGDRIYLLQTRPITTINRVREGELNIWDNSNIAESYGGITTPLTFSFARRTYEEVYRQFCRILKVPSTRIDANADTFARMLGLIRGRIYYNLLSWYRVLALLPGFTFNRRFMEQMMGVKEPLPQELVDELGQANTSERMLDAGRLLITITGLLMQHFRLPKSIERFYPRLNEALSLPSTELESMRADQLAAHYRLLERSLLTRWDAPLVNDFFAMIYYGILRQLCAKWCGDNEGTLQNDLLCGEGGMISTEPARRIRKMAELAVPNGELVELFCAGDLEQGLHHLHRMPDLKTLYQDYLAKFGDRCLDELKLESITLKEDPVMLLRSIGHLARKLAANPMEPAEDIQTGIRCRAEERVTKTLSRQAVKRMLFNWILSQARARVRDRENLRFERTRLFGRVRRLFVELGKRLQVAGHLRTPRDIFYLEVNEIIGFVTGTTSTTSLADLVSIRRTEFECFSGLPAPADRFETRGTVHDINDFSASRPVTDTAGETLRGIGCCPGVVRGPVRVITDPRGAELRAGEILVAERTDPGWVMLFPAASGLLVERGSLLSHSAIVAREMGIPAIVSLSGLTHWLKTGDEVEFDGSTGVVRRIITD